MQKSDVKYLIHKKIIIEAELPIALEELAMYVLPKKEEPSKVLDLLITIPSIANNEMRNIARAIIRKKKIDIQVKGIKYDYNDSNNMIHGVAYFKVKLRGTEKVLRRVAGENKTFLFDWQNKAL